MSMLTRSQFLKDLEKGWSKLDYNRQYYFSEDFKCACAIGAATYGSELYHGNIACTNASMYSRGFPIGMHEAISKANDFAQSKAGALKAIKALKWPEEYAS